MCPWCDQALIRSRECSVFKNSHILLQWNWIESDFFFSVCGKLCWVIFCLSPGGFVCSAQHTIWLQTEPEECSPSSPIASRGSPPFGSSKTRRNGEKNSGLVKRSGMKRRSRMSGILPLLEPRAGAGAFPPSPDCDCCYQGCGQSRTAGSEAPQGAWFVSSDTRLLGGFGVKARATMVFLFVVKLTQQPWDFPWLFLVPPGPPYSLCTACAKNKFQLYWWIISCCLGTLLKGAAIHPSLTSCFATLALQLNQCEENAEWWHYNES